VFIVSHMDHNSTIWAKCRDLVLNLTVHTTGLQRTIELPFTVSQTAYIKTGVIYIFYDTCSNFNIFFQFKIQDDDNLLLAHCGWTSSSLLTSLKNTRIYYIVFKLCFQNVQACQNDCHFFVTVNQIVHCVSTHTLLYCCTFYVLHESTLSIFQHIQYNSLSSVISMLLHILSR
jgi:hypothetical protein